MTRLPCHHPARLNRLIAPREAALRLGCRN